MPKRSVSDLALDGKRVLMRADFNVPLDSDQTITDDRRITQFLPTLEHVIAAGGRAILMSHLGRPSGDPQTDAALSLRPVAERIAQLTGRPCGFVSNCIGAEAQQAVAGVEPGGTLLLENLRFHSAETIVDEAKKSPDGKLTAEQDATRVQFGEQLTAHADVYVNDAFGTCHRNHVSMYDVPVLLGAGNRAVGFLVLKELRYLGEALERPKRPFVAVLGGAKVSDKIGVVRNLIARVDHILIGGAMTFTFWKAQGKQIGRSLCEGDKLDLARELIEAAGDKLHLPTDSVAAEQFAAGAPSEVISGDLPDGWMGLDIGPETLSAYAAILGDAGTIVWNGPVGAFELAPFDKGTFALAETIAHATDGGAVSIIGGGDSAAAVDQAGLAHRMTHISTGGGASLKFLEGKKFDPIEIIDEA
jgi:phosphoglycerate kinase